MGGGRGGEDGRGSSICACMHSIKIKMHSGIEDFVETRIFKLCVIL